MLNWRSLSVLKPRFVLQRGAALVTAELVGLTADQHLLVLEVLGWQSLGTDVPLPGLGGEAPDLHVQGAGRDGFLSPALRLRPRGSRLRREDLPGRRVTHSSRDVDQGGSDDAADVIGYPSCTD